MTTVNPGRISRRPAFDPTPGAPLRAYGWHSSRDGIVSIRTAPTGSPQRRVVIGTLGKVGTKWVARTPGGCPFVADRQQDAGAALYDWATGAV